MRFRPCIDIHNGRVKQLVGASLTDKSNSATENFVSEKGGAYYADMYKNHNLKGGHIIILNAKDSEFFQASKRQAIEAVKAYPQGMQIGGGINHVNAYEYIKAGATHVIVTSFVFTDGIINWDNLEKLVKAVGKEHIVLDLSCKKKDGQYYIVTNRWQTFTEVLVNNDTLNKLAGYCDEFLVHGVDVEGTGSGMDRELVTLLAKWREHNDTPITYAGGIASIQDIEQFSNDCNGKLDFTIGSALDLFGGTLDFVEIAKNYK